MRNSSKRDQSHRMRISTMAQKKTKGKKVSKYAAKKGGAKKKTAVLGLI